MGTNLYAEQTLSTLVHTIHANMLVDTQTYVHIIGYACSLYNDVTCTRCMQHQGTIMHEEQTAPFIAFNSVQTVTVEKMGMYGAQ